MQQQQGVMQLVRQAAAGVTAAMMATVAGLVMAMAMTENTEMEEEQMAITQVGDKQQWFLSLLAVKDDVISQTAMQHQRSSAAAA
jgi:predicted regulator of Ras-like GTPase activity (Roadblock/LC7/MglB family)